MLDSTLYNLTAIASVIPIGILTIKRHAIGRDSIYWALLIVAVVGPLICTYIRLSSGFDEGSGGWPKGLATTIWVTISISMIFFVISVIISKESWRLTPLVSAYMTGLGILAFIWSQAPETLLQGPLGGLVSIHITVSVATYALVTLAAIAALAGFIKETALKAKKQTPLSKVLPSVTGCDHLLVKFLVISQIVLAIGLATGIGVEYSESGQFLRLDHKTILVITTFVVIGGLLIAHYRSGLRGRKAARIVLVAYLLLTLGYPGVKFVTDILLT